MIGDTLTTFHQVAVALGRRITVDLSEASYQRQRARVPR